MKIPVRQFPSAFPLPTSDTRVVAQNGVLLRRGNSVSSYAISTDNGRTWEARNTPGGASFYGLIAGGGYFVAVTSTTTGYKSVDGETWVPFTTPISFNTFCPGVYHAGVWAFAKPNTTTVITTADLVTWASRTLLWSANWSAMAGHLEGVNNYLVLIANGSVRCFYANVTNLASWAGKDFPNSRAWSDVCSAKGSLVATAGTYYAVATVAGAWTEIAYPFGTGYTNLVPIGSTALVAVGYNNYYLSLTSDLRNWENFSVAEMQAGYGSGVYLATELVVVGAVYGNQDVLIADMQATRAFVQPDHASKAADQAGFDAYCGEIEEAIMAFNSSPFTDFLPYALGTDMTVRVMGGAIATILNIRAGLSPDDGLRTVGAQSVALAAPSAAGRIDRLCIDISTGALTWIAGVEAQTPVAPAYLADVKPVCSVRLEPGQTVITNAHITDERATFCTYESAWLAEGSGLYGQKVGYVILDTPGTYSFPKPTGAKYYRITLVGAGGGGGGAWASPQQIATSAATGGGGGGGATLPSLMWGAEDLSVVVGAGGAGGLGCTQPNNDASAGYAGGATSVTGVSTGRVASCNGGGGGGRGVSTPSAGAAGTGGAAPTGGYAGVNGTAGATGAPSASAPKGGDGGNCGEQGMMFAKLPGNSSRVASYPFANSASGRGGIGGAAWDTTYNQGSSYLCGNGQSGGGGLVLIEVFR